LIDGRLAREANMASKPRARSRSRTRSASSSSGRRGVRRRGASAAAQAKPPRKEPGRFGIRTAPKGDRFHAPERAVRKYALGMPEASEDYPWGHRAFRVGKKVFLFLAWDDGVFSATAKLPQSQGIALTLPFAEPTGYGMGRSGWVTARFSGKDAVPVGLICAWIDESYRAIAPKALAARLKPA
jgi:predicted DNA-binding protein (MmcQ/YjbR family)